jgi:K+-transporting ATPase A subunit
MWVNTDIFVDNVHNPVDRFIYRHLGVYTIVDIPNKSYSIDNIVKENSQINLLIYIL